MEKILIVGGGGFLGLNWIDYLKRNSRNFSIIILSKSKIESYNLPPFVEVEIGDYTDLPTLENIFSKYTISKVFHFASTIIPALTSENIRQDIEANLLPTINLMEVMKKYNVTSLLFLSTGGAVYGNVPHDKVSELHSCKPISSYGIIKLAIEHYIQLYAKLFHINYLILRVTNPFGWFHQSSSQGVINIAVRKALKGEALEVWGEGNQSKDYIFAQDISFAIDHLLQANITNEIINVGSGQTYSLNQILEHIQSKIANFKIVYSKSRPTDVQNISIDISKLSNFISWEPTSFDLALEKTIEFEQSRLSSLPR